MGLGKPVNLRPGARLTSVKIGDVISFDYHKGQARTKGGRFTSKAAEITRRLVVVDEITSTKLGCFDFARTSTQDRGYRSFRRASIRKAQRLGSLAD